MSENTAGRTAGEAGWHASRYNLIAELPDTDRIGVANLFRASFAACDPGQVYLLSVVESLPEDHPILPRFRERGLIVDFDEREALAALGRAARAGSDTVTLTICTTMRCNFDCPYCFEKHSGVDMSEQVQADTAALAERMLRHFRPKKLHVIWFGGEPLLAPGVIWSLTERLRPLAALYGAAYTAGIVTNGYLLTQPILDRLAESGVGSAIIALDGVGAAHDRSRHLKGGGPTFEKITENLRTLRFPFPVSIRHVVTEDNIDQMAALEAFTAALARESGNRLSYAPDSCGWNNATDDRGADVKLLREEQAARLGLRRDKYRFVRARGCYCGAGSLASVDIDARGALFKCWPEMDNLDGRSFGSARDWDPAAPLETAADPEQLTRYLDTALPNGDEKCWECRWLPYCVGGCPYIRVNKGPECLPYRDRPEDFVRALYARALEREAGRGRR